MREYEAKKGVDVGMRHNSVAAAESNAYVMAGGRADVLST